MDLRPLDGYLLDGKPSKHEAIEHILRDRLDDPRAAPFYRAFAAIGDLVVTGPTRTNVNDFRAILVSGKG